MSFYCQSADNKAAINWEDADGKLAGGGVLHRRALCVLTAGGGLASTAVMCGVRARARVRACVHAPAKVRPSFIAKEVGRIDDHTPFDWLRNWVISNTL